MRKFLICFLVLISVRASADGWEGSDVRVPKGTIMCDFLTIEKGMTLQKAGAKAALQSYIDKDRCYLASDDMRATVVKDASDFTDPHIAQILLYGTVEIWVGMEDVECCYE